MSASSGVTFSFMASSPPSRGGARKGRPPRFLSDFSLVHSTGQKSKRHPQVEGLPVVLSKRHAKIRRDGYRRRTIVMFGSSIAKAKVTAYEQWHPWGTSHRWLPFLGRSLVTSASYAASRFLHDGGRCGRCRRFSTAESPRRRLTVSWLAGRPFSIRGLLESVRGMSSSERCTTLIGTSLDVSTAR